MKKIFVLTDGMCENPYAKTTLEMCKHPNLDVIANIGTLGLYEPHTRDFVPNPETYVVFPFFWGLRPKYNPGRAGWEIVEAGIDINEYQCCGVFRVIDKSFDVREGWYAAKGYTKNLEKVDQIVNNVAKDLPLSRVVKSFLSRTGNLWCLATKGKEAFDDFLNILQFEVSKLDMNVYSELQHNHIPMIDKVQNNCSLLGWTIGPLLFALKSVDIKIDVSNTYDWITQIFDYDIKRADFHEYILPGLNKNLSEGTDSIIYIKEPSAASRHIGRSDKIVSISFIDEIIGVIIDIYKGQDIQLIVLCDHQSNIGIERTFSGPTLYGYCNLIDYNVVQKMVKKFNEKQALKECSGNIIPQEQLVTTITSL